MSPFRINLVSFRASKGPLLSKPVSCLDFFCCFFQQTGSTFNLVSKTIRGNVYTNQMHKQDWLELVIRWGDKAVIGSDKYRKILCKSVLSNIIDTFQSTNWWYEQLYNIYRAQKCYKRGLCIAGPMHFVFQWWKGCISRTFGPWEFETATYLSLTKIHLLTL